MTVGIDLPGIQGIRAAMYKESWEAAPLDDDLYFACRCIAILGPFTQAWRREQIRSALRSVKALQPWRCDEGFKAIHAEKGVGIGGEMQFCLNCLSACRLHLQTS